MHGRHEAPRGPLTAPIVQASTFAFASAAEMRRYLEGDPELFLYTRYANPTVRDLEEALAALEGAEAVLALSSGMAAMTTAVVSVARAGDEVLASASLYGGTVRLLTDLLPRFGISSRFLRLENLVRLGSLAEPARTVLIGDSYVWCLTYGSPANYMLYLRFRHQGGAVLTFYDGHAELIQNPDTWRWQP